jgi:predicted house-cleaning noncanonical NTP pyrophosphatase (MazG superfamily)
MARSDIRNTIGNLIPSGRLDNHGAANAYGITQAVNEAPSSVDAALIKGLDRVNKGIKRKGALDERAASKAQASKERDAKYDSRVKARDDKADIAAEEREQAALDSLRSNASIRKSIRKYGEVASTNEVDLVELGTEEFKAKYADTLVEPDFSKINDKFQRESLELEWNTFQETLYQGATQAKFKMERTARAEEHADEFLTDGDPEELDDYLALTRTAGMNENEQWAALTASITKQVENGNAQSIPMVLEGINGVKDLDLRKKLKSEFKSLTYKKDVINYAQQREVNKMYKNVTTLDDVDQLQENYGSKGYMPEIIAATKRIEVQDTVDTHLTSIDTFLKKTLDASTVIPEDDVEITIDGRDGRHTTTISKSDVEERVAQTMNSLRANRDDPNAIMQYQQFLVSNDELPSTVTREYTDFVSQITNFDPQAAKANGDSFSDLIQGNMATFTDMSDWISNTGNVHNVSRKLGIEPSSRTGMTMQLFDTLRNTQGLAPEVALEQASRMVRVGEMAEPIEKSSKYAKMLNGTANTTGLFGKLQLDGVQKRQALEYADYAQKFMTTDEVETQLKKMYQGKNELVDGYQVNNFDDISKSINNIIGTDYAEDVQPQVIVKDMLAKMEVREGQYSQVSFDAESDTLIINGSFKNEDGDEERRVIPLPLNLIQEFIEDEYKDDFLTTEGSTTVQKRKWHHPSGRFWSMNMQENKDEEQNE